jgi:hypothetical protein
VAGAGLSVVARSGVAGAGCYAVSVKRAVEAASAWQAAEKALTRYRFERARRWRPMMRIASAGSEGVADRSSRESATDAESSACY